ncbi:MAG TPA: carboxylating nicotinate-nucleotide diphosphorylase [Bacteroidetes bacterium]|nr:carboxylating nicotinate-nucleotide diphosphorylase [Bacteroidota bacterium]
MTAEEIIRKALEEDLGPGDFTSLATVDVRATGKAVMLAKETGIVAGTETARQVFEILDTATRVEIFIHDGEPLHPGDRIMTVSGKSQVLLSGERTALNYIQRMSGIATFTAKVVDQLKGLHTKVLDTRKTTPCNRLFEKMAVKAGGGENHRFGLYDMIMIKDNHIDFAGGIRPAIEKVHRYLETHALDLKIEIETRNFKELEEVLATGGIDRIMLDNFTPGELKKALEMIGNKYETEASGGITLETIRAFAETGVDYISVGALTHQIKSLDISLKAVNN